VLCVAGTPLGHRALSGHPDGVLVLWDLDLGAEIGRMAGHNDLVRCATFLPDGHRALAGSQFGNLILWDVDARRELRRFYPAVGASEHVGQLGIAVFADLLHALTADTDATVRLWRLPSAMRRPRPQISLRDLPLRVASIQRIVLSASIATCSEWIVFSNSLSRTLKGSIVPMGSERRSSPEGAFVAFLVVESVFVVPRS
jgi:hypothetical protein